VKTTEPTLQNQLDRLQKKVDERSLSKELKLPDWPETKRGTPNSFLRSALFSAIQSKDRVYLKNVVLASQEGITVNFTGEQLNQEDLTLWETLVYLAKDEPLGNICKFTAYDILKSMELNTGGDEYNRLETGITRLNACSVKITHGGKTYFGSLIDGGIKDELTSHYTIQLNKQLIRLYSQNTWIDWEQRMQLKRKPLAQTLHGYYSSHKTPYPVKLTTLQQLSGCKNKQASSFKRQVSIALDELVRIGFLESYNIDDNKIIVKRK
jgi:TrfA protein